MGERGLFGRLRAGLQKTRQALRQNLESVLSRQRIDAETLEDLEEVLIMADLGGASHPQGPAGGHEPRQREDD